MNVLTFYSIVAVLVGACRISVIPLGGMMPVSELLLALVLAHAGLCAVLNRTLPARPAARVFSSSSWPARWSHSRATSPPTSSTRARPAT